MDGAPPVGSVGYPFVEKLSVMSITRPLIVLLGASFALAGAAIAQEEGEKGESADKIEEIVEERAAEEARDGEPAGADLGEASYNIENCAPANGEKGEMTEGSVADSNEAHAEGAASDSDDVDSDAEGVDTDGDAGDAVEKGVIDDCEQLVK